MAHRDPAARPGRAAAAARVPMPSSFGDDGYPTETTEKQEEVEEDSADIYHRLPRGPEATWLARDVHTRWQGAGLRTLPSHVSSLDASRTWLCYWTLHACDLMGTRDQMCGSGGAAPDPAHVVDFLRRCFTVTHHPDGDYGGFGGGPGQIAHLAPTFSAAMALCIVGSDDALSLLKERRELLTRWFLRLRRPDGATIMHLGGETDIRAAYCLVVVATLTGIATPDVLRGMVDYVARCQTHEGGLACQPYEEAHGGYTFCGTACLALLRRLDAVDMPALRGWLSRRQAAVEGGFNGRTNKLTDACYSFWVGGTAAIVAAAEAEQRRGAGGCRDCRDAAALDAVAYADADALLQELAERGVGQKDGDGGGADGDSDEWEDASSDTAELGPGGLGFDQEALQAWILCCCQAPSGGLRDKPGVGPDYYHTCYSLSGLAVAQDLGVEHLRARLGLPSALTGEADLADLHQCDGAAAAELRRAARRGYAGAGGVFTHPDVSRVLLRHINPLFNIRRDRAARALRYFHGAPILPPRVA